MTNEIQKSVLAMQKKIQSRADVVKNANGTYSHKMDRNREWDCEKACAFDLRLTQEYYKGRI